MVSSGRWSWNLHHFPFTDEIRLQSELSTFSHRHWYWELFSAWLEIHHNSKRLVFSPHRSALNGKFFLLDKSFFSIHIRFFLLWICWSTTLDCYLAWAIQSFRFLYLSRKSATLDDCIVCKWLSIILSSCTHTNSCCSMLNQATSSYFTCNRIQCIPLDCISKCCSNMEKSVDYLRAIFEYYGLSQYYSLALLWCCLCRVDMWLGSMLIKRTRWIQG